jgi:hypothetical protein
VPVLWRAPASSAGGADGYASVPMVRPGRASGGDGGQRWLIVALVVTVLVLIVDASIKSAAPTPARQLGARVWLDSALPVIVRSDVQGADLAAVRAAAATGLAADRLTADLAAMTGGAATAYRQLEALRAPPTLQRPASLLETALWLRSQAAGTISSSVGTALRGGGAAAAAAGAQRWAAATQQLELADQAYRLFAAELPGALEAGVPASTWVPAAGPYSATDLEVVLRALQSRTSLLPVHLVELVTVGTTPSPMGSTGPDASVELLPPSSSLSVTAVVGNLGNVGEHSLTVTAAIAAADGPSSARRSIDLTAGGVAAVTLTGLAPRLGPNTLTVTVTAPAGAATRPVDKVIRFQMPAAPTTSTTTTRPSRSAPTTTGSPATVSPATVSPATVTPTTT